VGLAEHDPGHVRASDGERNRIADELRVHCAEGRFDIDELELRLERAMTAATVRELAELVADLPALPAPGPPPEPPAAVRLGPPGIRPFTQRIEIPAPMYRVRRLTLDSLASGLNGIGYELITQSPETLYFQRSAKERVTIELEPHGPGRTTMIVHGRAARRVRKQFAQLRFDR
jgi:hypothetical protein